MARKNENKRLPKIGLHSSGQARCTIGGKVHYLGAHGSLEAQQAYTRLIERWEANGRRPLDVAPTVEQVRTVRQLVADYLAYLDRSGRYHRDGVPTDGRRVCKTALDEFAKGSGTVPITKLADVHIIRHRDTLEARAHLTRAGINKKIGLVRAMLRWARERHVLTREQWFGVAEIRPLTRHECGGRDWKKPKRAVSPEDVERVAAVAPPEVARMMRVHAAVGMRPGEVCAIRWCDISPSTVDVDGVPCRIYTVARAKADRFGRATTYALPPTVVDMLGTPTAPGDHVFPSPVTGGAYHRHAYRNAVARACERAQVQHFGPHELRHAFLTRAAQRYGVLAASAAGNHADTRTTSGYLHANKLDGYRCVVGLAGAAKASAS